MSEPRLTGFNKIRPLGTSFRADPKRAEEAKHMADAPANQYLYHHHLDTPRRNRRRARSNEWEEGSRWEDGPDDKDEEEEGGGTAGGMGGGGSAGGGTVMQTLDRRISASSDQLDTLRERKRKPTRTRSSYRQIAADERIRKTPFEMFLEDDGPYSRRLYGPVQGEERRKEPEVKRDRKQSTRRERIFNRTEEQPKEIEFETPRPVKRGILWQQKDKLFSRWKERYFVLTKDYIHCFKKGSGRITEMGGFVFKVKLCDIEVLELVDRRGYLTITISQVREGRIFLRTTQGLQDWYNLIQAGMYESKKRRKFWVTGQHQGALEHWLLERQHRLNEDTSGSAVNISPPQQVINISNVNNNSSGSNNKRVEENKDSTVDASNMPKGINRLSLVTGLLMNEAVKEYTSASSANNSKFKGKRAGNDSGLESGNSLNTSSDSQSDHNSGPEEGAASTKPGEPPDIVKSSANLNRRDSFNLSTQRKALYRRGHIFGQSDLV